MGIRNTGQPLIDLSLMPYGKHKGIPMQDVPVHYLHWLWHEGKKYEHDPVAEYIRRNLDVLKTESEDLIWS